MKGALTHTYGGAYEHGLSHEGGHGMDQAQVAAMFAKAGKEIATQKAPKAGGKTVSPSVLGSTPKAPLKPKAPAAPAVKAPKVPKATTPKQPKAEHPPKVPKAPKGHAPQPVHNKAAHQGAGHAKHSPLESAMHVLNKVQKVAGGASAAAHEAAHIATKGAIAASGQEATTGAMAQQLKGHH